jgi:hypothetical protein
VSLTHDVIIRDERNEFQLTASQASSSSARSPSIYIAHGIALSWGLGFGVWGLGIGSYGEVGSGRNPGVRVPGSGFGVSGFGLGRSMGYRSAKQGVGDCARQSWETRGKTSDIGFRVSGLGFGHHKECSFARQGGFDWQSNDEITLDVL